MLPVVPLSMHEAPSRLPACELRAVGLSGLPSGAEQLSLGPRLEVTLRGERLNIRVRSKYQK